MLNILKIAQKPSVFSCKITGSLLAVQGHAPFQHKSPPEIGSIYAENLSCYTETAFEAA
jgi:hypothetical protein